jgi:oligopeptide/dipeptide ABC transporter ATP-binding protein
VTPVLEVRDLRVYYPIRRLGRRVGFVRAVDGVSFTVRPGEILGVAGESGCGKSTLARGVLHIVRPTAGRVVVEGVPLDTLRPRDARRMRRVLQMVFQDPHDSLNPRVKVGAAIEEALLVAGVPAHERPGRVRELLETVGLPGDHALRYPHELSGGQRQRVGIARALGAGPKLLLADEAVSALDVSVRAQIINLFLRLKKTHGLGALFISHDLAVLRHLSDRLMVMYLGRVVEEAGNPELYEAPLHPYTQALLAAVPLPDPVRNRLRPRIRLRGEIPSPSAPPSGCPFHPRCPLADDRCRREPPELLEVAPGHRVACHYPTPQAWKGGAALGH